MAHINGRYFARFPVEIPSVTENDNPIMENQVLRVLMNLGGVTQEKLLRWCQTEAEYVRRLRYKQTRRGRLEMKAYSILARLLYVLTLPLSCSLWLAAAGFDFFKGFFSNGQNVFIVGLIGLSMAWQAGVAWKVVNATAALDAEYFRSLEEEMMFTCFDELTPKEESRVVSQLVKSKLYLPLRRGEAGIDYSGVDIDAKLQGLSSFFGNFPVASAVKIELLPFLLEEVSKFAAKIKGTPLEDVIEVRDDGFWFVGEEVALNQNAEWAVERYASNIVNAYDAIMHQVWDQRPSWHLVVGSLKAAIAEEVDTLVEELGFDCDELLKSAHHRLQTSLIKTPHSSKAFRRCHSDKVPFFATTPTHTIFKSTCG
ncbi:hypothetical protein DSO57_1034484 [Entomophthora muscae]|uniref:Uncharacterized protein n=1 Tax=Entomophthora muscae TaxID=34485 RepID=A0ACC2SCP8_9FUNG|nr:hypothetical protein DSO57_1034484 [Entomophthora muscae]